MENLSYRLYLVFIVSWFVHLAARVPLLGTIRIDLLLVVSILALMWAAPRRDDDIEDPLESRSRKYLLALIGYIVVTLPLVQWPGSVLKFGLLSLVKSLVFFFFTVRLIDTEKKLKVFILFFVGCQAFRALEPLYLHLTTGYWGSFATMSEGYLDRLSGSPYDIVNPNGLAFVILTTLPLAHYLCPLTRWGTVIYAGLAPALVYALVLTSSRSGLVGLAVVFAGIFYLSQRRAALVAGVILGTLVILPNLTPEQRDRYLSIVDSDTNNAVTADFRKEGLLNDSLVILHRPLFGHGLGTSLEANINFGTSLQLTHNLYIEVGQELGLCGLAIFLGFIGTTIANYAQLRKRLENNTAASDFLLALAKGGLVWLGMNCLFSFFSYGLRGYEWYLFSGVSIVICRLTAGEQVKELPKKQIRSRPARALLGERSRLLH